MSFRALSCFPGVSYRSLIATNLRLYASRAMSGPLCISAFGRTIEVPRGLLIDGKWLRGSGSPLKTVNPCTEEIIAEVDSASAEDVDMAVTAARRCFVNSWGLRIPPQVRGRLLNKLADLIERDARDLSLLESLDNGKPIAWARADVVEVLSTIRFYALTAAESAVRTLADDVKHVTVRREPMGVVAQITPWNYPLLMWAWKIAPALAAGCAIVFKPPEVTPLSILKVSALIVEAGFPDGAYNCLNGLGSETGAALSRHTDVDKIAFTGSTVTGRAIAIEAAKSNLKKVALELGGKSPHIVFEGANLDEAAKWVALGIFENNGQSCTAGSRLLLQSSVYDQFMELLVAKTKEIIVGPPDTPGAMCGPLVSRSQFERVLGFIERAQRDGARLVLGGKRMGQKGFFIEPTIFADVDHQSELAQEEVFGPVLAVMRFDTEEEAIRLANGTKYGLAAGLHSSESAQIDRVTSQLKAGTVWVNHFVYLYPDAPFGGYKQSGWGRELGVEGYYSYQECKAVHASRGKALEWPVEV